MPTPFFANATLGAYNKMGAENARAANAAPRPLDQFTYLARLGAYVRGDGKLCDGAGRPIEFFRHYDAGAPLPADMEQRAHEELRSLREKARKGECSLVVISRDPKLPPPE